MGPCKQATSRYLCQDSIRDYGRLGQARWMVPIAGLELPCAILATNSEAIPEAVGNVGGICLVRVDIQIWL